MDEIIDSLIVDCNNSVRLALNGNYIAWCNSMVNLTRNLELLREKVKDEQSKNLHKIEELKTQLKNADKDGV